MTTLSKIIVRELENNNVFINQILNFNNNDDEYFRVKVPLPKISSSPITLRISNDCVYILCDAWQDLRSNQPVIELSDPELFDKVVKTINFYSYSMYEHLASR